MADKKIKQKEEELIAMVSKFSDEYLDEEFKQLNIKLIQKLGRKHDVPFKRGKLENWAGGIVYTIGQLNFLFDDSINPYVSADEISDYFGCSKSTARNKASDIRKLLNLKLGNPDFSTELVIISDISSFDGDLSQVKTLFGAQRRAMMNDLRLMRRK